MIKLLFNFIFLLPQIYSYLTHEHWLIIKNLKQNINTPDFIHNKIDKIIYTNSYNSTTYEAYLFRKKNWKHLKRINKKEIESYACMGLLKAIKNYNGKYNFYNFAKIYIHSELVKSISELTNPNLLPHRYRTQYKYKNLLNKNKVYNYDNEILIVDKINNIDELNKDNIYNIVNNLDSDIKRTFYYRHGYNLDFFMPIHKVSELMCWSNETTRLKLTKAYSIIKKNIKNY